MKVWDVIIIGAGAAGLMCAAEAALRGHRVLLLEHGREPGRKILISGGGRCNFTNREASPDNYLSENPHFCKSALARYTPFDFLALVEAHGIAWYEKKLGQLFCRDSARQILDMLLKRCQDAGVQLLTGVSVQQVTQSEGQFCVQAASQTWLGQKLVLACGGLSIPKVGASDLGYRLLQHFGHRLVPTRPALVPLTLHPTDQHLQALRGLSLPTRVSLKGQSFVENTLFTHFGLSGPAILQISSYWQPGQTLEIDFMPDEQAVESALAAARQQQPEQHLQTWLKQYNADLPQRWLQHWKQHYLQAKPLKNLPQDALSQALRPLQHWQIQPAGTAGYGKAEVTAGGADTRDFSSKTMASRHVPGLYCIGELLDVTGWLGGYNFQWAWASAYAAAEAL